MLASELLDLLKERYPDRCPLVEISPFRAGELAAVQKIISEIETEIKNGGIN